MFQVFYIRKNGTVNELTGDDFHRLVDMSKYWLSTGQWTYAKISQIKRRN